MTVIFATILSSVSCFRLEGAIRLGKWKYIWRAIGSDGWTPPPEYVEVSHDEENQKITKHALLNLNDDPLEKENLVEIEIEQVEVSHEENQKKKKHKNTITNNALFNLNNLSLIHI